MIELKRGRYMAKVTFHTLMKKIRGRLGDSVFRCAHTGIEILSKAPDGSRGKDLLMNIGTSNAELVARLQFKIGT